MGGALQLINVEKIKTMSKNEFREKFVGDIAKSEAFGELFFQGVKNISTEDRQIVIADLERNGYRVASDDELDKISIAVSRRAVTLS